MVFRSRCSKEVMSHLEGHDAVVLAGQPLAGAKSRSSGSSNPTTALPTGFRAGLVPAWALNWPVRVVQADTDITHLIGS